MKLREIQVYENRNEYGKKGNGFIFEAYFMTVLYGKFLPMIETENIRKIIICCGTTYKQKEILSHYEGILEIGVPFDVQIFLTLEDEQKKVRLLEMVYESLLWIANIHDIDEEPFNIAYQKCIDANYECIVTWKKSITNSNRQNKAIVEIEVTLYKAILILKVVDRSKVTVKEVVIVEEKPNIVFLERFLGDLKWISNEEVHLYPKHYKEGSSNYFSLKI